MDIFRPLRFLEVRDSADTFDANVRVINDAFIAVPAEVPVQDAAANIRRIKGTRTRGILLDPFFFQSLVAKLK
jgi:hypothetical protein